MKILLIEPNQLLADTYTWALAESGHQVDWQHEAQVAILAADRQTPDVVILELQLPGHNGIEFLYEFRSYPEWQEIPVIINSFTPDQLTPGQKKMLGIASYLYKPTANLQKLTRAVT